MGRAMLVALGVAVLWGALAFARPSTTFHLAPAIVAWTPPYLVASSGVDDDRGVRAALAGGSVAAVGGLVLAALGRLDGPVLFGGSGWAEAVIVAGVATAVAAVVMTIRQHRR